MVETQKSVVFVQVLLSIISLTVFFIPYGTEISLSSLIYIGTPYGLVMVLMLLIFMMYNVHLNWLNGASYESSYFLNLIFVPLFFFLNIMLDFIQFAGAIVDFYLIQFLISILVTGVVMGMTIYLALRVDQRYSLRRISRENNIKVSLTPYLLVAAITFGVFLIEGLIFLFGSGGWFFYNAYALIDVFFHFFVAALFVSLYFIADSSLIINIKDRLYLGVGLSTVTIIYSLYFYGFNFNVVFDHILNGVFIGFEAVVSLLYLVLITLGLGFARYYISHQSVLKQKNYFAIPVNEEELVAENEKYEEYEEYLPDSDMNGNANQIDYVTQDIPESIPQFSESTLQSNELATGKSRFTGGLLELVAVGIVQWLIIIFTLGIGTPFAIVFKLKWMNSHTFVEGRQLEFTGNALDLILQWIKWLLLSFITFGIYGFWVGLRMHQWIARNTVFKRNT